MLRSCRALANNFDCQSANRPLCDLHYSRNLLFQEAFPATSASCCAQRRGGQLAGHGCTQGLNDLDGWPRLGAEPGTRRHRRRFPSLNWEGLARHGPCADSGSAGLLAYGADVRDLALLPPGGAHQRMDRFTADLSQSAAPEREFPYSKCSYSSLTRSPRVRRWSHGGRVEYWR
jgi:hypothetical protein